jgi:RNA polymerase sigma factor (sigma-70 family)
MMNEVSHNNSQFGPKTQVEVRNIQSASNQDSDAPSKSTGKRVFTVDQLATMFNVSTKTISRWRNVGLEGRMFEFGGRKQLGFPSDSVEQFVRQNPQRVRRGRKFSQMSEQERAEIIKGAKAMSRAGCGPTDIVKRLTKKTGRSDETVRYTIKRHDQEHPHSAILGFFGSHQSREVGELVYEQHLRGTDVGTLAKRFGRSKMAITKMIGQMRAKRIFELPLDYMPSSEFEQPGAEQQIAGAMPEATGVRRKTRIPTDLPAYLASLYDTPLLTTEQEVHQFRKYNYLKYRACSLRETLDPEKPSPRVMEKIERAYDQAAVTKNQIIQANLRLVVSIVKRYTHDAEGLFERISEGNVSLMRAVDKFDYTRGFKFSTYATWAIKNNYSRASAVESKLRERFQSRSEESMFERVDQRADPFKREAAQRRYESSVKKILGCLDEREQRIIKERFGLGNRESASTLKEVGVGLGVSKERVRQIESRALAKLREAAGIEKIELDSIA